MYRLFNSDCEKTVLDFAGNASALQWKVGGNKATELDKVGFALNAYHVDVLSPRLKEQVRLIPPAYLPNTQRYTKALANNTLDERIYRQHRTNIHNDAVVAYLYREAYCNNCKFGCMEMHEVQDNTCTYLMVTCNHSPTCVFQPEQLHLKGKHYTVSECIYILKQESGNIISCNANDVQHWEHMLKIVKPVMPDLSTMPTMPDLPSNNTEKAIAICLLAILWFMCMVTISALLRHH